MIYNIEWKREYYMGPPNARVIASDHHARSACPNPPEHTAALFSSTCSRACLD